jgi:hypothetical protein
MKITSSTRILLEDAAGNSVNESWAFAAVNGATVAIPSNTLHSLLEK